MPEEIDREETKLMFSDAPNAAAETRTEAIPAHLFVEQKPEDSVKSTEKLDWRFTRRAWRIRMRLNGGRGII